MSKFRANYVDNLKSWIKTCKQCKYDFITNSLEEMSEFFYKVKSNKDGLKLHCKECKPSIPSKTYKFVEKYDVETAEEYVARGGQIKDLGTTDACHIKLQFSSRHFGPNRRTRGSQPILKVPIKFSNRLEPIYSEQGFSVLSTREGLEEE